MCDGTIDGDNATGIGEHVLAGHMMTVQRKRCHVAVKFRQPETTWLVDFVLIHADVTYQQCGQFDGHIRRVPLTVCASESPIPFCFCDMLPHLRRKH